MVFRVNAGLKELLLCFCCTAFATGWLLEFACTAPLPSFSHEQLSPVAATPDDFEAALKAAQDAAHELHLLPLQSDVFAVLLNGTAEEAFEESA